MSKPRFVTFKSKKSSKKSSLEDWEKICLTDIFNFWPACSKNMTNAVADKILESMDSDAWLLVFPSMPIKDNKESWRKKLKEVYRKRKQGKYSDFQWNTKQCKTIDSICDNHQIKELKKWLKKEEFNINAQNRKGESLLTRQCDQKHNDIVEILIQQPNIAIEDRNIGALESNRLKDIMLKKILRKQLGSSSSSSTGGSSKGEEKIEVREECGHYSIYQGQIGSCYIVSVITLFRNEKSILKLLKLQPRHKSLQDIIELLETQIDFTKQCPKLPATMTRAVTQNRSTRSALTKNGGSAYTLMMYIMNIINILEVSPVFTVFDETYARAGIFPLGALIVNEDLFRKDSDSKIGYIDIDCAAPFLSSELQRLEDFCKKKPSVKGFIFQLANGKNFNHVVAACICDGKIYICNSWGRGCQTDLGLVVNQLTEWGSRPLTIQHMAFILTKNIDDD
jgi:hypothetical protein